jgi:hypothetical protein
MEEAERKYAVELWKQKEADGDAVQYIEADAAGKGSSKGKSQRYYLETHVEEIAAADYGSLEEAMRIAGERVALQQDTARAGGSRDRGKAKGKAKGRGGKHQGRGNKHSGDGASDSRHTKGTRRRTNNSNNCSGDGEEDIAVTCLSLADAAEEQDTPVPAVGE